MALRGLREAGSRILELACGEWADHIRWGNAAVLLAVASALVVVLDGPLSGMVPRSVWERVLLEHSPFKLTPLLAVTISLAGACIWFAHRVGSYRRLFVLAIFPAAQANALRIGFLDIFDVLTLVFLMAWLAEQLQTERPHVTLTGMLFFAAALLVMDVPLILHQNPVRWAVGLVGLLKVVLVALVFVNVVRERELLRLAVRVFVIVAVISGALAVVQFVLYYFGGVVWSFIDPIEEAYKPTPIGMVLRSSALSVTAQHVSGFLVLALPFLLFQWSRFRRGERFWLTAAIMIVLTGILVTWNFGAFFVLAGVLTLFPLLRWRSYTLQILLGYAALALVAHYTGLLELAYDLTLGDAGVAKGTNQREALMLVGFEKIWRNPWVGVGLRDMAEFSGNYWRRPVHNAYMQALTELGLLGGVVLLAMLSVMATQLLLAGVRARGGQAEYAFAGLLSLLGLGALMLTEPMLEHSNTWLLLGLLQTILLLTVRGEDALWQPAGSADARSPPAEGGRPGGADWLR